MGDVMQFKPVKSIFDGWKRQCKGWWTDYKGGRDVLGWLNDIHAVVDHNAYLQIMEDLKGYTDFLSAKYHIPKGISFRSGHSLVQRWGPDDYPTNVLVYANDVIGLTPEDFRHADLEYQFSLEDGGGKDDSESISTA